MSSKEIMSEEDFNRIFNARLAEKCCAICPALSCITSMETRRTTAVATCASCQGAHTRGFIRNNSRETDSGGLYDGV